MKSSFEIKKCRLCDTGEITRVINLGDQPLANNLKSNKNEQDDEYPLVLCKCSKCHTLQLSVTVKPEILFSNYVWVTGTSKVANEHSERFFLEAKKYLNNKKDLVIEIASNDGTFLKPFYKNGFKVLGVDPAKNIAKIANQSGIKTLPDFFSSSKAEEIVQEYGTASLIFARNVIPHVPQAKDIIKGIALCLKNGGIGIIEFHRADIILKELHYDSIYHEHYFYYSIKSLSNLLSQFDLYPFDVINSPISGGSYVIYFSNLKRGKTISLKNAESLEEELGIEKIESWNIFASKVKKHSYELKNILETMKNNGKTIVAYGASARSSTLLNYCRISTDIVDLIIDQSEMKHGSFTAGTKIKITSPSQGMKKNPDAILLLAWNFKDEIIDQLKSRWNWSGDVIIPLPGEPKIIKI